VLFFIVLPWRLSLTVVLRGYLTMNTTKPMPTLFYLNFNNIKKPTLNNIEATIIF